ncbi:MAG: diguanylate cyclase [Burkholderiaceae bacterium]|nr:diguanylate cyclase [Burkholderiaceae bacterium]
MEAFVWDQNFITGLEDVDDQHHALVDLFNELSETFQSTDLHNREALLNDTFARLVAYTEYHFRDEEALMRGVGIDPRHIALQEAQHAQFVRQINDIWSARHSMPDTAESIIGFLTSWLGLHILGTDQALARQIVAVAAGATPEQAWNKEHQATESNSTQALLKLIDRLYHVLAQQNAGLINANRLLEERVAQRTQQLAQTNEELQHANRMLEAFSRTDGLLGIANRNYFDERLAQACAAAFRREQPLALLMIDVDHFKQFNDCHGHPEGDRCLQAVARAVQQTMTRSTDLVARYGGEELAVILPDTDAEGAATVAARVVANVAALALIHGASQVSPHVSVSVGAAAQVPPQKFGSASLVEEADAALYEAKAGGRNRWVLAPH